MVRIHLRNDPGLTNITARTGPTYSPAPRQLCTCAGSTQVVDEGKQKSQKPMQCQKRCTEERTACSQVWLVHKEALRCTTFLPWLQYFRPGPEQCVGSLFSDTAGSRFSARHWPWWTLSPAANSPRILGFTKGKFADWRGLDKPKTSWTTLTPRARDSTKTTHHCSRPRLQVSWWANSTRPATRQNRPEPRQSAHHPNDRPGSKKSARRNMRSDFVASALRAPHHGTSRTRNTNPTLAA